MTVRTHDAIRLIAVILNIPMCVLSLMSIAALVETPWRVWDAKAAFVGVVSLAPIFALVAIMAKPASAESPSG